MSKIRSITRLADRDPWVYDPMCTAPHNYVAGGIVNHNCCLWIDEVEKALSGTRSSGQTDGGTTSRVFSTLLTAMEEDLKGVTTIVTANDISKVPPEFIRRFDEVFFIDLPLGGEREQIFRIHLRLRGRDPNNFDLKETVEKSEGFTGDEVRRTVKEAITLAFNTGAPQVTTRHLLESIKEIRPLYLLMQGEIEALREWAKGRAKPASLGAQQVLAEASRASLLCAPAR